jgi:hypothetical protein
MEEAKERTDQSARLFTTAAAGGAFELMGGIQLLLFRGVVYII